MYEDLTPFHRLKQLQLKRPEYMSEIQIPSNDKEQFYTDFMSFSLLHFSENFEKHSKKLKNCIERTLCTDLNINKLNINKLK